MLSFGPAEVLATVRCRLDLPWRCLLDPERQVYARYGLGRATVASLLRPRLMRRALGAMARGHRPRAPVGDPMPLGGDFVVAPGGRIAFAYPSRHPDDRPSVASVLAAIAAAAGGTDRTGTI